MTTTTKVIIGLTLAAATGAAVGMLLAPEKGTDAQRKLKAYAKDWMAGIIALLESSSGDTDAAHDDRVEISDAPEISNASRR